MIRIVVDSSSDIELDELKRKNIELVPLNITIGEKSYEDNVELSKKEFYEILTKGEVFPKTSQPAPQVFLNIFEDAKAKGDQVICILLSSALSGTLQSATIAKGLAEYDDIYIIDSLSAAVAIKIMADVACKLRDEGKDAKTIVEEIETLKSRVKIIAMVDTLEYLARGGRISQTTAKIGEFAKVKPIITVAEDGTIEILGKCIGKAKAMNAILKQLKEIGVDENYPYYSVYSLGEENCEKFEGKLVAEGYMPKNRVQIGATIGTHIGPGAFGFIYVKKQ